MAYETVLSELPAPSEAPLAAGRAMLMFGTVPFEAPGTAYQTLKRVSEYRQPSQDRVHQRPIHQSTGVGRDTVELDGVVFSGQLGVSGPAHLAGLRALAEAGEARILVSGTGEVFGKYVVTALEETRTRVFRDGAARRVAWRLKLARYGDDAPGGRLDALEAAATAHGDVRAVTEAVEAAVAEGRSSAGVRAAAEGAA